MPCPKIIISLLLSQATLALLLGGILLLNTGCMRSSMRVVPNTMSPPASTTTSAADKWPAWINWLRPYQPPLSQGVFITSQMVSQLRAGMSRAQVKFLLGTPPINDIYLTDRWVYPFQYDNGAGFIQTSLLTIFFNPENNLDSIAGENFPDDATFIQLIGASK